MQTRDKTKYICFVYDNRKSAPTEVEIWVRNFLSS